jgi:diguanylate cyclase (GGDEF)-like protein
MIFVARIRTRILLTFLAASSIIALLTLAVIQLQLLSVDRAARLEATDLARSVAYGVKSGGRPIQSYVQGLDALYKRDIVIVDANQNGLADAHLADIGRTYTRDLNDEVGQTIIDGAPRDFIEHSARHPDGAREIAVPMRAGAGSDGPIVGAVVLEYTAIHAQLLQSAAWQLYAAGGCGVLSMALVCLFGLRLANAISDRLTRLQDGVAMVAKGRYDTRLNVDSGDEIGALTSAFNGMTDDLRASHETLLRTIHSERETARAAEFLASHDKLTGLSNRSMFSRSLESVLLACSQKGTICAVLFVDLDRFKNINDTLGHEAGDQLLQEIASRLSECVGSAGLVARLGGDEFVITLHDAEDPEAVSAMARRLLAAIARPVCLSDHEFRVTASIGISRYPSDGDDERTLMKRADVAMYQAKEDGKNSFAFYSEALDHNSIERLAFESSLRHALEGEQLRVVYQPKVNMKTGLIDGVEALLRWQHPELGIVSPTRFIPVAEETGMIVEIGEWVLRAACRQYASWRAQGLAPMHMAVNLSPRQFFDERMLATVQAVIAETGMDAHHLELEITESMLMRDVERAGTILRSFKQLGIRLSIDDFGTGYSSLSNLKRFPVDTIKVDRSFVRDLPDSGEDRAIAEAIIAMGRALGLTVIAEGVESLGQLEFLSARGCDQYQGFYFSKPVTAESIGALLTRQANAELHPASGSHESSETDLLTAAS